MTDERKLLDRAIALAVANVTRGGGPFGALVAIDGEVVAEGQSRMSPGNDPIAHAEVTAIRRACAEVDSFSLAGHTLYSSCEPCPLCLASSLWSGLDRVVYAADRDDAARAGFDDAEFRKILVTPRDEWGFPVEELRVSTALDPFDAWVANDMRTHY